MALLLTDAGAKRRSSAQGSQAAGASRNWCAVHPRHGSENCGYTSFDQCWATIGAEGGWCRPNPFSGTPYGTGHTWFERLAVNDVVALCSSRFSSIVTLGPNVSL
jgi:hypothetical protein